VLCAFDDTASSLGFGLFLECPGATSSVPFRIGTRHDATQARDILIRPGNATGAGSTHNGADITIQASDANGGSGTRNGGHVRLQAGNGATAPGSVTILSPTGATFYSTSAASQGWWGSTATQQTGVAVTAAAIHAALVNYGLITA